MTVTLLLFYKQCYFYFHAVPKLYHTLNPKLHGTSAGSSFRFARPPCYYQLYKIKNYDVTILSNYIILKRSFVEFRLTPRNGEKATAK